MYRAAFFLVSATLALGVLATEVYKTVDPENGVEFSDRPSPGATRIDVPPPAMVDTRPPPPSLEALDAAAEAEEAAPGRGYERVTVVSPAHDETLRDNAGNVLVSVETSPGLRPGHRLTLLLDGAPWGEPGKATNFALTEIDRGTHTLSAVITDERGKVVAQSPPSTFHLHRHSIQHPPPRGAKPPAKPPAGGS